MPKSSVSIGIFGGMGPSSGYDFFGLITDKIKKELKPRGDHEHPKVVFLSDPTIPRKDVCVRLLEENNGVIPPELDARPGLEAGIKFFKEQEVSFIAVPCNTFHYFRKELEKKFDVEILNMISIVADSIVERARFRCLPVGKVGLLATSSTVEFNIYDNEFKDREIEIIKPTRDEQNSIDKVINLVKSGEEEGKDAQNILLSMIQLLEDRGAQYVVLGCTELPLVIKSNNYKGRATLISSTEELAQATIREISHRKQFFLQRNAFARSGIFALPYLATLKRCMRQTRNEALLVMFLNAFNNSLVVENQSWEISSKVVNICTKLVTLHMGIALCSAVYTDLKNIVNDTRSIVTDFQANVGLGWAASVAKQILMKT